MLHITHNGYLYRWAYALTIDFMPKPGETTNLCTLFWRCVLLTPLKILICGVAGGAIIFIHALLYYSPIWQMVFFPAGMVLLMALVVWVATVNIRPGRSKVVDFTRAAYRGVKERYCHLVRVI